MERPIIYITPNHTLAYALRFLAATKIHRVFVCNEAVIPERVISLSDIVRYLLENSVLSGSESDHS